MVLHIKYINARGLNSGRSYRSVETIRKGCFVGEQEKENNMNHCGDMANCMMLTFSNKKKRWSARSFRHWFVPHQNGLPPSKKGGSRTFLNRSG